ncbi:S8 family peptidase [Streptomyces sp. NPDC051018]|uniref:S8 family peptidase n=1 Tax=Streptomyces sp. NPDC051018 TaxID=3365639 RepID=UPI00378B8F72
MGRTYLTAIAAAGAVALTGVMTGPASAGPQGRTAGGTPSPGEQDGTPRRTITLITGDRVLLDASGQVAGVERAKGRGNVPVHIRTSDKHTFVVPGDAQRLITEGKLDERLFDITELSRPESLRAHRDGLKVIIGYRGSSQRSARADVRATDDVEVRRSLKNLNADAVTAPDKQSAALWDSLTRAEGGGDRAVSSGVDRIWLDATRKAVLDRSTRQIGAPAAWDAGHDGTGVRIAVLDSGIDTAHPDLKDQVVGEQNFSSSHDARDRNGHGTHVASIAAGTGAKSGGKFKGVAPGAKLLNGKVIEDGGWADESAVLAGIDWAVAQGADVINLSLGGWDTPELDPLETQINKVSADTGVLFAVAAGNEGPHDGSLTSPGSAQAALTVGSVDGDDRLAERSGRGRGIGAGDIKPDVTGPGEEITAASAKGSLLEQEFGEGPEGYLNLSGTSMAAPHAAGAAALLKQKHPAWKAAELKGVLTGSARPGPYTVHQQGTGRIAVDGAMGQSVVSEPVSLTFGTQLWPHADDTPVTKKVTYRNLGTEAVTLDVTATATDPAGRPAPEGFFTPAVRQLTVPAGGTASVDVTADTRLGGTADGTYSGTVVASGGGQTVRTAVAVDREVESYELTVDHIGRNGSAPSSPHTVVKGVTGPYHGLAAALDVPESGTATIRTPKGSYALDSESYEPGDGFLDIVTQPKLDITGDTKVTVDARTTKPFDIRLPRPGVEPVNGLMSYKVGTSGARVGGFFLIGLYRDFRTAHLGPPVTDGSLTQLWSSTWESEADATSQYDIAFGGRTERVATGVSRTYEQSDLARVDIDLSALDQGGQGVITTNAVIADPDIDFTAISGAQPTPGVRTTWVSESPGVRWNLGYGSHSTTHELGDPKKYRAGKSYRETFGTAVFGPAIGRKTGVFRDGDRIGGDLPLFADGKGHPGEMAYGSGRTTLHRNGQQIGEYRWALNQWDTFQAPAGAARYTLTTSADRGTAPGTVASRTEASWTFRSDTTASRVKLPLSTVRFAAAVGLDSTAPAGQTQSFPLVVEGAAAHGNLRKLSAQVSYDRGRTWQRLPVQRGRVTVQNPAKGEGISFRAEFTDRQGNKGTVSLIDAYLGR